MFRPLKRVEGQDIKRAVIANAVGTGSYPISVGDAIQPGATGHAKYVTVAGATNPILGIVTSIVQNGKVSEKATITGINAAETGSPSTGPGTDNETYAVWSVDYIPSSVPMEYEADISAVAGTTTDSSAVGGYFNLKSIATTGDTYGTLDESSIVLFSSTQGQFVSFGYTPYNTLKVFCKISKFL